MSAVWFQYRLVRHVEQWWMHSRNRESRYINQQLFLDTSVLEPRDLPMFSSQLGYILEWTIFRNNFSTQLIEWIILYSLQYLLLAFLSIANSVGLSHTLGIISVLHIKWNKFNSSEIGLPSSNVSIWLGVFPYLTFATMRTCSSSFLLIQ